jgi:hypothetical protein
LEGFSNEEINSKFVDMVCAMINFKNINEETLKNGCRVMYVCEVGFQHMTDRHCHCCHGTERRRRGSGGQE